MSGNFARGCTTLVVVVVGVFIGLALPVCQAETKTWIGSAGSEWDVFNGGLWYPMGVPGPSDDVIITNAQVQTDGAAITIRSLVLTDSVLTSYIKSSPNR